MNDARTELKRQLVLDAVGSLGEAHLPASGSSMLPTIRPGDVLEVHRESMGGISIGDVVVFEREARLVTHRVVEKLTKPERTLLITRGDALRAPDPPVSPEELLGRVTAILRGGRRLDPRLTPWARVASWFLARSEFCARVARRLSRR
jgi:signal peptidase I